MKSIQIINGQELFQIPVPAQTRTYSPISHQNIVERIQREANFHGFHPVSAEYHIARDGKQVIGYLDYKGSNDEFGIRVGFRNSYDKSMSFAFTMGSVVWICGNGMISGEINTKKQHRGQDLFDIIDDKILTGFNLAENVYNKNVEAANMFKKITIDPKQVEYLIGKLFLENKLINSMQLNVLKDQLEFSKNFTTMWKPNFTVWDMYNAGTECLKLSHPTTYLHDHINFHQFMLESI